MRPQLDPFRRQKAILRRAMAGIIVILIIWAWFANIETGADAIISGIVIGTGGVSFIICLVIYTHMNSI